MEAIHFYRENRLKGFRRGYRALIGKAGATRSASLSGILGVWQGPAIAQAGWSPEGHQVVTVWSPGGQLVVNWWSIESGVAALACPSLLAVWSMLKKRREFLQKNPGEAASGEDIDGQAGYEGGRALHGNWCVTRQTLDLDPRP